MRLLFSNVLSRLSAPCPTIALAACLTVPVFGAVQDANAASRENLERQSLFGSYLSGRIATRQRDMDAAADHYERALIKDPNNSDIVKQALRAELATANWDRATALAPSVVKLDDDNRQARLFLGIAAFKGGKQNEARTHFGKAASGPIGELASALSIAWTYASEGDSAGAFKALDALNKAKWAQYYRLYHRALIADVLGLRVEARKAYDELFKSDQRTLRLALAYAQHAASASDFKLARKIIGDHLKVANSTHPLARALLSDVRKNTVVPLLLADASDGMAEVFYSLGEALTGEGGVDIGAIYLQFSFFVRPDFPMALVTMGSVYEATRRYDKAIEIYGRIPAGSPLFFNGEVRRAVNLNQLKKFEEARTALNGLVDRFATGIEATPELEGLALNERIQRQLTELKLYDGGLDGVLGASARRGIRNFQSQQGLVVDGIAGPTTRTALDFATGSTDEIFKKDRALRALLTLGAVLRGHEKFEDAVKIYSRAIALLKTPTKQHWRYFYSRGVSYERLKNWPKAEADLQKALELNPDEPLTLNYLGYSWVDQNLNLKKALGMIKKAVKIKPDDGYFVDSLGWAYYRQGKYEEAAKYLERAVELRPEDPTINDHLGDAYWHVGRQIEARFQWEQSLSLGAEKDEAVKIRNKIANGLSDGKKARLAKQSDDKSKSDAVTE